jgi:hypothetical protein
MSETMYGAAGSVWLPVKSESLEEVIVLDVSPMDLAHLLASDQPGDHIRRRQLTEEGCLSVPIVWKK